MSSVFLFGAWRSALSPKVKRNHRRNGTGRRVDLGLWARWQRHRSLLRLRHRKPSGYHQRTTTPEKVRPASFTGCILRRGRYEYQRADDGGGGENPGSLQRAIQWRGVAAVKFNARKPGIGRGGRGDSLLRVHFAGYGGIERAQAVLEMQRVRRQITAHHNLDRGRDFPNYSLEPRWPVIGVHSALLVNLVRHYHNRASLQGFSTYSVIRRRRFAPSRKCTIFLR